MQTCRQWWKQLKSPWISTASPSFWRCGFYNGTLVYHKVVYIYIYLYIFWRLQPKRISYGGNIVDISALSHPGSYPSHQWLGIWTCIFRISRFTWGGLSCARTGAGKDYGILCGWTSGPVPQCLAQELGRGLQIVVWRPAGGWEPISRRENPVPRLGLRAHCWFGSSLLLGYPNIHREWSRLMVLIFWS